jgi:cytochrome c peroxidase
MTSSRARWSFAISLGLAACEPDLLTNAERERLEALVNVDLDPLPDPVNKYVGDPGAEALGHQLFFDARLSGPSTGLDVLRRPTSATRAPAGEATGIACATCHDPARGGVDHTSVPGHVSIGAGIYDVNAQTVYNAAYYTLKYWNGRYDSLVWQAMAVTESFVSMNANRMRIAWWLSDLYRAEYEAVFTEHPLPDFGRTYDEQAAMLDADGQCTLDAGRCPTENGCVEADGCWPRWPLQGRPADGMCTRGQGSFGDAFDCMTAEDQATINRTYVNFAKAIAAYEFRLVNRRSPFDRFMNGEEPEPIGAAAQRGAKLFVGKASCVDCHSGPLLSDERFHNVGVPQAGAGVPTEADCPAGASCDCVAGTGCLPWGARSGLAVLKVTTLRADNAFSDDPQITDRLRPWYDLDVENTPGLRGAWRTPSLRGVAETAPYMHDGYYRTLEEVVRHYNQGGTRLGSGAQDIDVRLRPLDLTEPEIQDLVAFLKTLTGEALPAELVGAPELP